MIRVTSNAKTEDVEAGLVQKARASSKGKFQARIRVLVAD